MLFNKSTILLVLLALSQMVFSQQVQDKLIHGYVFSDSLRVKGIDVINLVNEKSTKTNEKGEFYILAKTDDVLVISGDSYEIKRKLIEEDNYVASLVIINLLPKSIQLDEVVVHAKPDYNAVSLGIVGSDVKKFTPAERRLNQARSGLIERPLNWISGRTKMLKKELVNEGKQILLYRVSRLYEENYYTETLQIPYDYISDFQHFIIEDKAFVKALKAKNKTLTMFWITKLATNYKQIMSNENIN
jgi:hypothetical protein